MISRMISSNFFQLIFTLSHMSKKITILCLCLGFFVVAANAQNTVTGIVSDSLTCKPLPLVTVRLLNDRQTVVSGAVTGKNGSYRFVTVPAGSYSLQFSLAGYTIFTSALFIITDSMQPQAAAFYLAAVYHDLGSVTVRLQRPIRQRIDGYLYNAKEEAQAPGDKAADVLRRLPGVMVSPEGAPSMNGSSRIRVFIDNRPSNLFAASVADALQQVAAENISTIEIITHPGAKYEGEGVEGVILITTKRPVQNLASGTINVMLANRNMDINGNILFRHNKLVIAADFGYYTLDVNTLARLSRQGAGALSGNRLTQQRSTDLLRANENGGMSMTWLEDSLTTYTASYRFTHVHDKTHNNIENLVETGAITDAFTRVTDNPFTRGGYTWSGGYYKKSRDRKTDFNFLASGFNQPIDNSYYLQQEKNNTVYYRENNNKTSANSQLTTQVDFAKEFKNQSKIETGGRISYGMYQSNNDFEIFNFTSKQFVHDAVRTTDFDYKNTIAAAYLSYGFNLYGLKLRTGIRYEYTRLPMRSKSMTLAAPEYSNLLPNILLNRTFKGGHTVTLGYARRLERPFTVYLNPLVNYIDSLNIEFGNPALKPVLINNYTFNYNYQKNALYLTTALFVNRSVNNIENVRILKAGGVTESTWQNISNNTVYGASFNLSYQGKRFSFNLNNTVRSLFFNTDGTIPSKTGWVFLHGSNFSYKFNHGFTLMSYVTLNSDNISFLGSSTGQRWYNILLIKSFNEGRLNVAARFDNFFTHYQFVTEKLTTQSFTQTTEVRNIYRFFKFSMSWKIGKKEVKLPATTAISSEN
jgi:outer membrane receptor protein involved in Fe transport